LQPGACTFADGRPCSKPLKPVGILNQSKSVKEFTSVAAALSSLGFVAGRRSALRGRANIRPYHAKRFVLWRRAHGVQSAAALNYPLPPKERERTVRKYDYDASYRTVGAMRPRWRNGSGTKSQRRPQQIRTSVTERNLKPISRSARLFIQAPADIVLRSTQKTRLCEMDHNLRRASEATSRC
jgi:hypothetical protein